MNIIVTMLTGCFSFTRTLKFSSEENVSPTLVLAADLPSLRFHIDEQKVWTYEINIY